jgi:SAM-dependent methyltransferase
VIEALGQRFARLATDVVTRRPGLWRVFRPFVRAQFGRIAHQWDAILQPDHLAAFVAALDALPTPPRCALDLGTGTGAGAFAIARRFPEAEVLGVDLADEMIAVAREKTPPDLADRVRFERGDASRLDAPDGAFDLVALSNMIPFFDELARVLAPRGHALFAFSGGADTPIYVPSERLRSELGRRGFADFADFATGRGTALIARKE